MADAGQETRHDRQKRLQARNDRNALITGIGGLLVMFLGLVLMAGGPGAGGGLILFMGVIAFAAGFFFRGRTARR